VGGGGATGPGFCSCPVGKWSGYWVCFECPELKPTPGITCDDTTICQYEDATCNCGHAWSLHEWECEFTVTCDEAYFTATMTSSEDHDHMTGNPPSFPNAYEFVYGFNEGVPFSVTLSQEQGHTHTIDFTEAEDEIMRTGGTLTGKVTSAGGSPTHTHTYTFGCAP